MTSQEITLNGYPAVQLEGKSTYGGGTEYNRKSTLIVRGNTCFYLNISSRGDPLQWHILNEILSKFKFTDPPPPTPTQRASEKFFDEVEKRMQLLPTSSMPMMGTDRARCDFDGDGDCDDADRAFFQARIGACRGDNNYHPLADGNSDGCINSADQQYLFP